MKFKVYLAVDGWRWRLKSKNGRIIADSGEAYETKDGAEKAVRRMVVGIFNDFTEKVQFAASKS